MEANSSRPEEGEISTSNSDIDVSGSFRVPTKPGRLYKKRRERKRLEQRNRAPGVHVQCHCNARKQLEHLQSQIKLHNVETIASEIVKVTSTTLKKYQNIIETLKLALDIANGNSKILQETLENQIHLNDWLISKDWATRPPLYHDIYLRSMKIQQEKIKQLSKSAQELEEPKVQE